MTEGELSELGRLKALVTLLTKHNKDLLFKNGELQSEIDELKFNKKENNKTLKLELARAQQAIHRHKSKRVKVLKDYKELQYNYFQLRLKLQNYEESKN